MKRSGLQADWSVCDSIGVCGKQKWALSVSQLRGIESLGEGFVFHAGIPIRSTLDNATTVQYAGLIHQLTAKSRTTVRDLDPTNDLSFLRIRTVKHEIMVAPGRWVSGQCGGHTVPWMASVLESIMISLVYVSHTDMFGSVVSEGYVVCSQPLTRPQHDIACSTQSKRWKPGTWEGLGVRVRCVLVELSSWLFQTRTTCWSSYKIPPTRETCYITCTDVRPYV